MLYAEKRNITDVNSCYWYHTMDLPGHGEVKGRYDLRGHEAEYLGLASGATLQGKRVLEIGPASGHLSFWMEKQGAEVVSLEARPDYRQEFLWNIPAIEPPDFAERMRIAEQGLQAVRNSYWFAHAAFGSRARVHYGCAYDIPEELGKFDVVTLGAVLLHNKSPHLIIESAARASSDTVIVVDILPLGEGADRDDAMIFLRSDTSLWNGWFHMPPKLTARLLLTMGFPNASITTHQQVMDGDKNYWFYTVVARRA